MIDTVTPARHRFPFHQSFPLRAADMDARGHVNNANFLTFFEIARRAFFHAHNIFREMEAVGQLPILKTQTCTYYRQLRYPATLDIGLRLGEIKARSFRFEYALFRAATEELLADGHTVHVWIDEKSERATEIPQPVVDTLSLLAIER